MDEQASFETRAVIEPRRAGWNRLVIAIPVLTLAAMVWAGASGAGSDRAITESQHAVAVVGSSIGAVASPNVALPPGDPGYPAQVIGLDVQRLDVVQARGLGRDAPIAISGWYVVNSITDCPPLATIYRSASLPEVGGDIDSWAYCDRSGVLYASQPDPEGRMPTDDLDNNQPAALGLPAVAVTLLKGVVMPPGLETIGADATPVVLVAHFDESREGCGVPAGCAQELVVDHLGWAAGL
jgi:hypothetical protein